MPAHDEEQLLPAALGALHRAIGELANVRPEVLTDVTVVLDDCQDGSLAVVRSHPWAQVVEIADRCVGSARRYGVATAVSGVEAADRDAHWLANTDADCVVGSDWLVRQVLLADAGADLLTGTVEPTGTEMDGHILSRWWDLHDLHEGHPYVHGANLGVRFSAYDSAGGFDPVPVHEDVRLVERIRRDGGTCLATSQLHIQTSSRTIGRAPHGFAAFLAGLVLPEPLTA